MSRVWTWSKDDKLLAAARWASRATLRDFCRSWGLLIVLLVLIALFSALRPNTFPTAFNFQSILSNKSISAMAALAAMIPIAANRFDLSMAFVLGISQVLAVGFRRLEFPGRSLPFYPRSRLAVGFCNGIPRDRRWYRQFHCNSRHRNHDPGRQPVVHGRPSDHCLHARFLSGAFGSDLGVPLPALYVLVISVVLWIGFEYLPVGRFLYVLGVNPKAGQLNGISERRYVTGALMASGLIAAWAGIVLQSQLQVGQSSVGPEFLLPAFTAALLGATAIKPGRVNVWARFFAVAVLAVTVAGLEPIGRALLRRGSI